MTAIEQTGGAVIPRGSVPARHVSPRSRRRSSEIRDLPSLAEVEQRLARVDDELSELVLDLEETAEARANAEADWCNHRDRILVWIADQGDKEAADIREARARLALVNPEDPENKTTGADLYRTFKILEALEKSQSRACTSLQTRATTLMSVAKGIRNVT